MPKSSCYAHVHMTPEEYGLWTYGRTVSFVSNIVYLSGRHIAQEFFETNKDAIYRIAEGLEAKGWAKKLRSKRRHPKTGQWISADYRFLSHDEWVSQYGDSFCKVSEVGDPFNPVENSRQGTGEACLETHSGLSRILDGPVEISLHPVENPRHQYKSNCDVQYKRESERGATTQKPLALSTSQINGQVSELESWMLGLDPPLKFLPASKDRERESTKAVIVRRLKAGTPAADIKSAIACIPLEGEANPSFAIRDSLDAAINKVSGDRQKAREQAEQIRICTENEQARAAEEARRLFEQATAESDLIEDHLGA
jgi:hypothetical protein